ncbi:MAG: hypothetical protein WCT99_03480 [Bacteroidota bacterium]|jgi:hypothetical protein
MVKLISTLIGFALLIYLLFLASTHLYEPARNFNLPGLLWFTHLMLLYIHEAGHLIFSLFGRTLYILGGSLMQVIAPLAWFIIALRDGSKLSNVALVFTGISIIDVSVYVKDAGMLLLPLIGGLSKAHHDWLNLARQYGFTDYTYEIGEGMFWCGVLTALYGIGAGVVIAIREFQESPAVPEMID